MVRPAWNFAIAMAGASFALAPLKVVANSPAAASQSLAAEMPELAGIGKFPVGTSFEELAAADRRIGLRVWYPAAQMRKSAPAVYRHRREVPGQRPLEVVEHGIAAARAVPLEGTKFPLVVMSHGYGGWAEHLSRLGETLASRGYVVISIDHRDLPFGDVPSFMRSFGGVLVNRSHDQQAVLRAVLAGKLATGGIPAQIDPDAIGLLGFSMGGYGTLTTAGVPLDTSAPAFRQLPPAALAMLPRPDPEVAKHVRAVVTLAPWGAQPDAMAWRNEDLGTLRAPVLLIDGDRDDVVDFERGVKRIFSAATQSDRYLLVYREAAHNIAGNPTNLPAGSDFQTIEFLTDPVWRKERIEAINAHFIGAFLDLHLKGDAGKRKYLDVPTPIAADGQWPSQFGQQWGGTLAGDSQPNYWRGFQRRWAQGLELHHKKAGE
jgi:predicted dienelactone hydrolase